MNAAIRFGLLTAFAMAGSLSAHADDPLTDPLPVGPNARLGTTRLRNTWSDGAFALSPDGRTLVTTTRERELAFIDADTFKVQRRVKLDGIYSGRVAYLPDGKRLQVETRDGVCVVDVETGRQVSGARFDNYALASEPAPSTDGTRIAYPNNNDNWRDDDNKYKPIVVTVWDEARKGVACGVTTLQNHLVRVSLSADGKVLATWGQYQVKPNARGQITRALDDAQESTVQLWDVETGKELCKLVLDFTSSRLFDPDKYTLTAAVSPDGKEVAVSTVKAGGIEFFDTANGKTLRRFAARGAPVKRLVYSADGANLAALGFDGTVQLWDLKAGKRLGVVESPVGAVVGVVFPEPGRAVAWAMDGRALACWEVPSGKLLHALEGHTDAITSIVFSADGKTIFTGGADRIVAEWDAATGKLRSANRLKLPARVQREYRPFGFLTDTSKVDATVLSPDAKRVMVAANTASPSELLVLDRATGSELFGLKTNSAPRGLHLPAFSPDGTKLFHPSASVLNRGPKTNEFVAPLWGIDTGRAVCDLPLLDLDQPFAFAPDGAHLVRFALVHEPNKWVLVLSSWNSTTGAKVTEHVVSTDAAVALGRCALAVGRGGEAVIAVGDANKSRLFTWDHATGKVVKEVPLADKFEPTGLVAFSPDGKAFASVGRLRERYGDRTLIRVYDTATGDVRRELIGAPAWVTALAFSPDGKTLAAGSQDTTVLLWDLSKLPAAK